MSELKRRLEKLEEERDLAASRKQRPYPRWAASLIGPEPKRQHMAEWIAGYDKEKAVLDAGKFLESSRCYRATIVGKTCEGLSVMLKGHEYYLLVKEGKRIDQLSAEMLGDWLRRHGFPGREMSSERSIIANK